jgi:lipoprotein-anchoring transpeptidase ErfK/SrfK
VNKPVPPPTPTPTPPPAAPSNSAPAAPISTGKVIYVNLTTQHLYAYEDGALVNDFLITSGRPELMTPTGTFTVLDKGQNLTFYSPWPPSSPYYYSPEFVPYALRLTTTGIYIHAAPWREAGDFGPGTQYPHTLPDGTQSTGSHGCINTTTAEGAWYYNWAPIGMPVVIGY